MPVYSAGAHAEVAVDAVASTKEAPTALRENSKVSLSG